MKDLTRWPLNELVKLTILLTTGRRYTLWTMMRIFIIVMLLSLHFQFKYLQHMLYCSEILSFLYTYVLYVS